MKSLITLTLLTCSLLFAQDINDPVKPISTATPQQQVSGDLFQILNSNYQSGTTAYGQPTNNLAQTNYGIWGMDEGACTALPTNDIFCIYGDTIEDYWDPNLAGTHCSKMAGVGCWLDFHFADTCTASGGLTGGNLPCLGLKAMQWIPNVGGNLPDPSGCASGIVGIDAGLSAGGTPTANYTGCWNVEYITNSSHDKSTEPLAASQQIAGLGTDADGNQETTGPSHTPDSAFVAGDHLYIEWQVTRAGDPALGNAGYMQESIVVDCGATSGVAAVLGAELPCANKRVWSQAPSIVSGEFTGTQGSQSVVITTGSVPPYACDTTCGGTGPYDLIFVDGSNQQEYRITSYTDSKHITISPAFINTSATKLRWNIMQHQQTNIGKFANSAIEVYPVPGLAWKSQLPAALQSVANVLVAWGSSWAWRQSNIYLLVMDASLVDGSSCPNNVCYAYAADGSGLRENGTSGGLTQAYYLTGMDSSGNPMWSNDPVNGAEELAVPLLTSYVHTPTKPICVTTNNCPGNNADVGFGIGKPSVSWHSSISRFVFTYGSAETDGLQIRTSQTPWGPWSVENQLLMNGSNLDTWSGKMVASNSGFQFNTSLPNNAPVTCSSCTGGVATNVMYESPPGGDPTRKVDTTDFPAFAGNGNWYAPYQYPAGTDKDFGNGTVGIYFHTSAYNPYVPFDFSVIMSQAPAPGFSLSSDPAALTIAAVGGGANATIMIAPVGGFSGTVNVSCTVAYNGQGSPNEPPTCSLDPAQVSVTSPNSGNTTLSIATTAAQMSHARPKPGSKGWVPFAGGGGFIVAVVFAGFLPRQRPSPKTLMRRIGLSAFLMVVCLTLLMAPACGGGGGGNNNPGTTVGSYTVTVNASSSSYATSISVPLTVQ